MFGREGSLGNWFLWGAHGRELCSRSQIFWEVQGNKGSGIGHFRESPELKQAVKAMKEVFWILFKGSQWRKAMSSLRKFWDRNRGGCVSYLCHWLHLGPRAWKDLDRCSYKWAGCVNLCVYVNVVLISSSFYSLIWVWEWLKAFAICVLHAMWIF